MQLMLWKGVKYDFWLKRINSSLLKSVSDISLGKGLFISVLVDKLI